jgi:predicted nucleotidyltransferase
MRLSENTARVIREQVSRIAPESDCYLFGSRAMDHARGGDIDLLLLTSEKLPLSQIRGIRRGILNEIGEQKLDIVNFPRSSRHPFKDAALEHALRI